jgi:hypothetical protein
MSNILLILAAHSVGHPFGYGLDDELANELSELSKQQSDALPRAAYIRMSEEEAHAYNQRGTHIREILRTLGKVKCL